MTPSTDGEGRGGKGNQLVMICLHCNNAHTGTTLICPICWNDDEHQFEYEVVRRGYEEGRGSK